MFVEKQNLGNNYDLHVRQDILQISTFYNLFQATFQNTGNFLLFTATLNLM